MKILYHHRVASKDGQYVHIEEIVSSLRTLGHEVIVCEPKSIQSTQFGGGSKVVQKMRAVLPGFVHELAELLYSVPDYLKLKRLVRQHRPDGIYERYNLYFLSGVWASKKYELPILLEVNAPLFEERDKNDGISLKRLAQWSQDYVWRNSDIVLPVTGVLAKIIEERAVPRDRLKVIPNGINRDFGKSLSDVATIDDKYALHDSLVLGFVGFVRDWHRLDRVLKVIAEHREKNWHLLLVGDGPERVNLQTLARKLGIVNKLTVTGITKRNEMASFINRFDIALQPDVVSYASPLKLFEYMYLAKPILAPNTENIREILDDGVNAILFDQNDQAFGNSLTQLCLDESLREKLGAQAREAIDNKNLYWDCNASKIVDLFDAVEARQGIGDRDQV